MEGRDNAVAAIMKDRMVPRPTPAYRASATGIVPKMSAYMGTPITVASTTENGFLAPSTVFIKSAGIQL